MPASDLIGTWALVSTEWKRADGKHANPFGDGAVGVLIYDASGYMSAQIMHAARAAADPGQHTGIDSAKAFNDRLITHMRERREVREYLEEDYE